jgi:hypothetical protein
MLVYRLMCAVMVAWAMNWVLARPEAIELVEATKDPSIVIVGPIAGAIVGFLNLAKRQGWGLVVSVANGLWTGILSLAAAFVLYLALKMGSHVIHNIISNFEAFLRVLGQEAGPVIQAAANPRLLGILCAASALTGLISEVLHWSLVRLRRARQGDGEEELV